MLKENPHMDSDYADRLGKCASVGQAVRPPDARAVLLAHAEGLREEAHRLETLARSLPPLPPEADRVLYDLAVHRRSFTR